MAPTSTQVFDFMGTPTDVRTTQATAIDDLITRSVSDLEWQLGRSISATPFTDILFEDGRNCDILHGQYLYFTGRFRDTYSITSISEDNVTLTEQVDSDDGNDYYLNAEQGYIKRVDQNWSRLPNAIKITGTYGFVNRTSGLALGIVDQILIEMVAAKSGLWKSNVETEGGTITTIRTTINDETQKLIDMHRLREV